MGSNMMLKDKIVKEYLDFISSDATAEEFARAHEITVKQATVLVNLGRSIHADNVTACKGGA